MSARLESLIRAHADGDVIASSTLQPGLETFEASFGAVAFRRLGDVSVVLGGPLAARSDRRELLRRFLRMHRRPIFVYVRGRTLEELAGLRRLHAAGMGVDRHADLEALLESPGKPVRGAVRKARRASLELNEMRLSAGVADRLRAINADYLRRAECTHEMSFINRPMRYHADGLRRVFGLSTPGRGLFGFAVLNPVFAGGDVTGYLLDILRFERTKIWGVWLSTVHSLAGRLRAEGFGLSLGLAPLTDVRRPAHLASRALCAQVEWLAQLVGTAPYVARLREMKRAIPGPSEPRFFASFSRSLPRNFRALMGASGVPVSYLFGPDLLPVLRDGVRTLTERRLGAAA